MRISLSAIFVLLSLVSCVEKENLTIEDSQTQESILSADGISMTLKVEDIVGESAVFKGNVQYLSDAFIIDLALGVQYSIDPKMEKDVQITSISEVDIDSNYHIRIKDLRYGYKYYYRAFIRANGITKYGPILSFETLSFTPPSVTAKCITSSSIEFKLSGVLPAFNHQSVCGALLVGKSKELYFEPEYINKYWRNNKNYQIMSTEIMDDKIDSKGGYSTLNFYENEIELTGLISDFTYYYRPVVFDKRDGRIVLGDVETIKTVEYKIPTSVVDISNSGTANCYIINELGAFKFKPTRGNENIPISEIAYTEVMYEISDLQLCYGDCFLVNLPGDVMKRTAYKDGYIYFEASEYGSTVIAAKNSSGKVLWSWHIWATKEPISEVAHNNVIMMDRNLGAPSSIENSISLSYGMVYQWGRKDPFLSHIYPRYDNGREYYYDATFTTWPEPVTSNECLSIDYTIENPMTRINWNNSGDWLFEKSPDQSILRWGKSKSIYDPCPYGWRVPTREEFMNIKVDNSDSYDNLAYYVDGNVFPYFGSHWYSSDLCLYWTSTDYKDGYAESMYEIDFYYDRVDMSVRDKCLAGYVRCIKE